MSLRRKLLVDLLLLALFGALAWYGYQYYDQAIQYLAARDYEVLNPRMLVLLAAIPFFWIMAMHTLSDLPLYQRMLSVLLKTALVVALTLSTIEMTKVERHGKKVCVIYLVDVSDSVPDDVLNKTRKHLQRTWERRGKHKLRLVLFANKAQVITLDDKLKQIPELKRLSRGNATNIQAALRMAYGLFPDGYLKRMVIVSDGNETEGNLLAELENASALGIKTSYRTFKSKNKKREVMVKGLEVDKIKIGIPFKVTAELIATEKADAKCTLYRADLKMAATSRKVKLKPGKNMVEFKGLQVTEGGEIKFRLHCATDRKQDQIAENNTYYRTVTVESKPKVLYVEGDYKHRHYMLKALRNEHFLVESVPHYGLPSSIAEMKKYDLIMVSDVPAVRMSRRKMQLLDRYVRGHQGGLILTGGQNSLGPGGYAGSLLEKLMPVRLDVQRKKKSPSVALILVIDRSGSMNGRKMELAKEAAKATAGVLSADSKIGVIVFDTRARRIVPLQNASYKGRIQRMIAQIRAGGGTDIYPALYMAYEDLQGVTAKVKHIILLSDGKSPHRRISELVQTMREEKITISTVGVGAYVDRDLLTTIAELGGGTPYFTNDAYNIPKIFLNETTQITRQSLVEEPLRAILNPKYMRAQILKGVDIGRAPFLLGYTVTRPKPRAEVILYMERYKEPLLVRWRQGLGKVVVFTSDVKSRWSPYWLKWKQYAKFWGQVIRDTMRNKREQLFEMKADVVKGKMVIRVDAVTSGGKFVNGLTSTVKVYPPDYDKKKPQMVKTVTLRQKASGFYEGTLPITKFGPYRLLAEHRKGGKVFAKSKSDVSYPYPLEYMIMKPNHELLKTAALLTGGYQQAPFKKVFDPGTDKAITRSNVWPIFLYFIIFLFLLDLILRRIRIGGSTVLTWKPAKPKKRA